MPLDIYSISYVQGDASRFDRTTRYCIGTEHASFYTFDPLVASLCLRAMDMNFPVQIGSRDTKYGLRIVTCEAMRQEEKEAS